MACGCKGNVASGLARFAEGPATAAPAGMSTGPRSILEYILIGVVVSVGTQIVMRTFFSSK